MTSAPPETCGKEDRLKLRSDLSSALVFRLSLFLFIGVSFFTTTLNISHFNWRVKLIQGLTSLIFNCQTALSEKCRSHEQLIHDHIDMVFGTIILFSLLGIVLDGVTIVIIAREDCKQGIIFVWLAFHNFIIVLALCTLIMAPIAMLVYLTTQKMRLYSRLFHDEINSA